MFPKSEKPFQKTGEVTEQLDLVETVSKDDKVKSKRRLLIILLSVSIGLCFVFWIYHSFKYLLTSPPQISLNLSLPSFAPGSASLSSDLQTLLSQNKSITALYLRRTSPDQDLKFHNLTFDTATLFAQLTGSPVKNDSPNSSQLPQGVTYREMFGQISGTPYFSALIDTPDHQVFIVMQTSAPIDSLKSVLPSLVSLSYWSISPIN